MPAHHVSQEVISQVLSDMHAHPFEVVTDQKWDPRNANTGQPIGQFILGALSYHPCFSVSRGLPEIELQKQEILAVQNAVFEQAGIPLKLRNVTEFSGGGRYEYLGRNNELSRIALVGKITRCVKNLWEIATDAEMQQFSQRVDDAFAAIQATQQGQNAGLGR